MCVYVAGGGGSLGQPGTEETRHHLLDTQKSELVPTVQTAWVWIPALPLTGWVTFGELLNA